jgi:nucleotide-binding universal stress UspA family protein
MVPTDGSGFDREAIRVALRIAERSDAKLKLVRVLSTGSLFSLAAAAEGTAIATEVARSERDKALSDLYALAAECRGISDADITVDLHDGPVPEVLDTYARRNDVSLIVMSTHGRSGFARLSLGSVTDYLIRQTSIPVLVVKPSGSYLNPQVGDGFRHIVVPLDGSTLAEQILPRLVALARLENADTTLLHVLTAPSSPAEPSDRDVQWCDKDISLAEKYLSRIAERLTHNGLRVRTDIVVSDNVAGAISDYVDRERADIIAIATHGRGGVTRMLRGSVADALMHSAKMSMLVFKPENAADKGESLSAYWAAADLVPA